MFKDYYFARKIKCIQYDSTLDGRSVSSKFEYLGYSIFRKDVDVYNNTYYLDILNNIKYDDSFTYFLYLNTTYVDHDSIVPLKKYLKSNNYSNIDIISLLKLIKSCEIYHKCIRTIKNTEVDVHKLENKVKELGGIK